jgi:WhiB family redox-sensing transcriptional regulator
MTIAQLSDQQWRANAACGDHVDDWLWVEHRPSEELIALAEARIICGACPAHEACLEYALADLSLVGIWAATTLDERRRMVRNRARKSRAQEATA